MNRYDYLAGSHDLLSLSDWGPYANDVYALSHIADRKRGIKFDFILMPGILRRHCFLPECLRESGCTPLEAAPDLSYFSFRQQMEGRDTFYADTAYAQIEPDLWLGRIEYVNKTAENLAAALFVFTRLAPRPEVFPVLPETARWLDALDYHDMAFSYKRIDHNLTFAGGRRGEQQYPGTVGDRCLGQPFYDRTLPCFGERKGDRVAYEFDAAEKDAAIYLRVRVDEGKSADFTVDLNGKKHPVTFNGTGNFEIVELCREALCGHIRLELTAAADSCGVRFDGLVIGDAALETGHIAFAPLGRAVQPNCEKSEIERCDLFSGDGLEHAYAVWWSRQEASRRTNWLDDLAKVAEYGYGMRQPYYANYGANNPGDIYCHDSYILPIKVASGKTEIVYALFSTAPTTKEAEAHIAALNRSPEALEAAYQKAHERVLHFEPTDMGRKYEFTQKITAATSLTNVNFPIRAKGKNIRHHVPDKYFNSLYSWDSGFIGLGFLALDKIRAIENLNVYVTEPDDDENVFMLYGTPLPVQAYLYAEIWNRYQDREMLEFFYPRIRRFYDFIAGHIPTSSFRAAKSNLLRSWDYFYNSGGWDDYPPQWYLYEHKCFDAAPVVTTAHAIRFAKFLKQAAHELGRDGDIALYDEDIDAFTKALQNYSWSEADGVFSYVRHDEDGNPTGIWIDPVSGVNFNFGMDGTSPLVSGICSKEQRDKLFGRLSDPAHMWTDYGISTVDRSAPYYRTDGYWNGCIWMPHQWFFWKSALDDNRGEFARRIASTALRTWHHEVGESRYTFEHFSTETGRGAGCCHFMGLSSPVLNWYAAYFEAGRITAGFDTWIREQTVTENKVRVQLAISGNAGDLSTLLFVSGGGEWEVCYNGKPVPVVTGLDTTLEITLPKATEGELLICRK